MLVSNYFKQLSTAAFSLLLLVTLAGAAAAQTFETQSPTQLTIDRAYLSKNGNAFHCLPDQANENAFENASADLIIQGKNFTLGGTLTPFAWLAGSPLTITAATDTQITTTINCADVDNSGNPRFSPSGSYRLFVATGTGKPFSDGISFGFARHGNNGNNGSNGNNGNNGSNGNGVKKRVVTPNDDEYANSGCHQGAAFALDEVDGNGTVIDTSYICHGTDGAPGQNGANGNNGTNGVDGRDGAPGLNGDPGANGRDGAPGLNGTNGRDGAPGLNGNGVTKRIVTPNDAEYANSGCQQGAALAVDEVNGAGAVISTDYICRGVDGNNGANGANGKDGAPGLNGTNGSNGRDGAPGLNGANGLNGAPGLQGPPGLNGTNGKNGTAIGWLKAFSSANITSASSNVLSQSVTGANGYVINAKLNVPFGNGAKSVTCNLSAVEGGISTAIDSTDANLQGSNTFTAKGVIALGGVYTAKGGAAGSITINASCLTGGDTRTLTKGAMNIVAADAINP
jgi:hypothetical protein